MRGKLLVGVAFIVFVSVLAFSSGEVDLTGAWEGETYVEGGPTLLLTLTLEHKGAEITGTLSDDMGYIDSEITEAKLEGSSFSFQAIAQAPTGEVALVFKVTVSGDSMEGAWESEDGAYSGEWTATREKGS